MPTPRTDPTTEANPSSSPVIAYTTGDDAHRDVRRATAEHAKGHGCPIILFVADAASIFEEPMPNQWASEGESDRFGSRLGPDDLEVLGRSDVAKQFEDARASGVAAFAWLPKDHGPGALAAYAREQRAHLIFVPEVLEGIDELSSLLGGATPGEELTEPGIEVRVIPTASEGSGKGG